MLANRIYRGDIVHKGEAYLGQHEPIVSEELWDEVQRALAHRSRGGSTQQAARRPSLLINLLYDGEGRPMSPSHSMRKVADADGTAQQRRYRYYQTRPDAEGGVAWRVTASDIEPLARSRLAAFLEDQQAILAMAEDRSAEVINAILSSALGMAAKLCSQATGECRDTIGRIVRRIDLAQDNIAIIPHINTFGLGDGGRYRTNIWDYAGPSGISRSGQDELAMHPTVKPVAMIIDALKDCSARGDVVLDNFAGSGSTLIAAEKCGRRARLI